MAQHRFPRFIIIGAAKAATTWIAHQLRQRHDVFLPGPEPHYFSRAFDRGETWYASLFETAGEDQLIGEKSADYLADPDAPRRIAALLPDVQLIVQLRNPIERAYSDYCMLVRRGQVSRDIDSYLDRARTQEPRFLDDGLYARHLGRYFDYFPRERIKIVLHEQICEDPESVAADICSTLALPPPYVVSALRERVNDRATPLLPLFLRRLPEPLKRGAAPLRGSAAFKELRRLLARPFPYPALSDEVRQRLVDFYRDDVARLTRIVGHDLQSWIAPPGPER